MRYTLFSVGSRGDVQPYAALGLALQARGHAVTLCVPENFGPLVRGVGLDFAPLPWDTRAALRDDTLRARLRAGDVVGFFRRAGQQARERQDPLLDAWLAAAKDADVLVSATTTEDAVLLLGQALGKRVLMTELGPFTPSSHFPALGLSRGQWGPLNRGTHWLSRQVWWRLNRSLVAALGRRLDVPVPQGSPSLAAVKQGRPVAHGFSQALFPAPRDWDAQRLPVTGAWRLPAGAASALPGDHLDAGFAAWLEDGPPPLYLGFGSMPGLSGEELLELAGDVAELLETRVVLGAGWTEVDSPDCDLPEGVAIAGDCDHTWLFQRCGAVVHHGGAGTTHAAAAAGLPQVVCPLFADQPFWGDRVRRAGAGVVVPFRRMSPLALAEAVTQVLGEDGACQDAATALAEAVLAEGGAPAAAEHLERWALG